MYGKRLREYLKANPEVSVKELSRRLNPGKPESARRSLYEIFHGREPRPELRQRIAEALGTTREAIEGEDEEEDLVDVLLDRVEDLTREVRKLQRTTRAAA